MTTVTITVEVDDLTETRRAALLVLIGGEPAPTPTERWNGGTPAADLAPYVEQHKVDVAELAKVTKTPLDALTKPNARPAVGPKANRPGTHGHAALTTLADTLGTWRGTVQELAEVIAHGANVTGAQFAIRKLERDGLIRIERSSPRKARAIHLTAAGWAAIGRTPPATYTETPTTEPPAPPPAPVKETPAMPDLGPIERRPFDPDRVRAQQAAAL